MRLASFFLALAMGIGAPGISDLAVHAKSAHALTTGVTLTIAPADVGVLKPGQDLSVSGILSNGTSSPIGAASASVYLNRTMLGTRAALSGWLASDDDDLAIGTKIFTGATPVVPAGQSRTLTFTIPAAAIGLGSAAATWGARGLSMRVGDKTAIATARSSIVWSPGTAFPRTKLAITMPITLPGSTSGLADADALSEYTAPGGILTEQLDEAIDQDVAIAIDPMVIASIRILGNSAPPTAIAWLDQLKLATNDTFALSYADSDISLSSQAGLGTVPGPTGFTIDPKLFPGQEPTQTPSPTTEPTDPATDGPTSTPTATPPPKEPSIPTSDTLLDWNYTIAGLGWPRDNSVVAEDLATFAASDLTTTILSSSNASYGDVEYTPGASATIDHHPTLISDSTLSALLRKAVLAPTEQDWREAMVEFSASVAIITSERPGQARTLLATLGRDYPTNGPRLAETLGALTDIPWLKTATLSDALAASPVIAKIVDKPQDAARVGQTSSLFEAEQVVGNFSSLLTDPTLLTGPQRLNLLAAMSNSWVDDPAGWKSAFSRYLKASGKIAQSVTIVDSSKIFQPADKIALPITIRNDLGFPVNVVISVRSPRGILKVVDPRVSLTIEPHSQSGARVAVQSVANGNVFVSVSITSPTGVRISQPSFVEVDVQAGWETAITVVIAVLVIGVFGFGIWRNISKRRKASKSKAPDEDDEPEDDAPVISTREADDFRG